MHRGVDGEDFVGASCHDRINDVDGLRVVARPVEPRQERAHVGPRTLPRCPSRHDDNAQRDGVHKSVHGEIGSSKQNGT
jgi:hypothetical protein